MYSCVLTAFTIKRISINQSAIQTFVIGHVYKYSSCPGNQHIEAWWSFFLRNRSQFWIDTFEQLIEALAFHSENPTEVECLRYCLMGLVQSDLDEIRRQWNTHRIRPSAGT